MELQSEFSFPVSFKPTPKSANKLDRLVNKFHSLSYLISQSTYFYVIKCNIGLYLIVDLVLNVILIIFSEELIDSVRLRLSMNLPILSFIAYSANSFRVVISVCLLLDLLGFISILIESLLLALLTVYHLAFGVIKLSLVFDSTGLLGLHMYFVLLALFFAVVLPHKKLIN